ncbi:Highly reducing polyketide synthase alt5 [Colletotrichum trifolii]|uniref:Highly reducing polyketide synthase alt5 n=1 Tax=Colletotrichum trifolii TaxID=5466 RepID=A0A4V3HXH8_COLTR|nr:Highly reducing polyketide synthase alt5 [Colletotrichum trifolii]
MNSQVRGALTVSEKLADPGIVMEGVSLASVGEGGAQQQQQSQDPRASCFGQDRTLKSKDDDNDASSVLDKLEFVCLVYMHRCLAWLESEAGRPFAPQDGFWKLYVDWMRATVADFPPLPGREAEVEAEMRRCRERIVRSDSGDMTVQMVDRIGRDLGRILSREVEPLQLMTEGDLLYAFYRGAFGTSFNSNVAEYVGLVAAQARRPPGWLGEDDGRTGGPLADVDEWNTALSLAGFSGADVDIRGDGEESEEPVSLIVSTKFAKETPALSGFTVVSTGTAASEQLAQAIQTRFASSGQTVSVTQWATVSEADVAGKYCLCLAEWEDAILASLTDDKPLPTYLYRPNGSASITQALTILGHDGVHHGIQAITSPREWVLFSSAADSTFPTLPSYTGAPFPRDKWDSLFGAYEAEPLLQAGRRRRSAQGAALGGWRGCRGGGGLLLEEADVGAGAV